MIFPAAEGCSGYLIRCMASIAHTFLYAKYRQNNLPQKTCLSLIACRFGRSVIELRLHLPAFWRYSRFSHPVCDEPGGSIVSPLHRHRAPACQTGFRLHESLRHCHRRAAHLVALPQGFVHTMSLCTFQRSGCYHSERKTPSLVVRSAALFNHFSHCFQNSFHSFSFFA